MHDIIICKGIQAKDRSRAAHLYSEAFQRKFAYLIGSKEKVAKLLELGINIEYCFGAYEGDKLIGILGYHYGKQALIDLKVKDFIKVFGPIKGVLKACLAGIMFYRKVDNGSQLLMDGIAVASESRGKGCGTALFDAFISFAKSDKYQSIKLDVIDENQKAKALYMRLGFRETKKSSVPFPISKLIGVTGTTTMVKKIGEAYEAF